MLRYTKELDASWATCPSSAFYAQATLKKLANGEILKLISTEIRSVSEIQLLCKQHSYELLEQQEIGNTFVHYIKK